MAKRKSNSGKNSRTRSGCLTCRDRHMKCDEQQPVCKNCIKSKRKCYRGVRLNFTQYTIYNPQSQLLQPLPSNEQQFRLLDQSITVASLYKRGRSQYERYFNLHTPEDLREADLRFEEEILSHSATSDIYAQTENYQQQYQSQQQQGQQHQHHQQQQHQQQQYHNPPRKHCSILLKVHGEVLLAVGHIYTVDLID